MRGNVDVEEETKEMWRERGILAKYLDEAVGLQGGHADTLLAKMRASR